MLPQVLVFSAKEISSTMTFFNISGKVAIITGGASGLGFQYARNLLEKGSKGVTLADVCEEKGIKSIDELNNKFGNNKAIFVKADVTNYEQFERAFKETITAFNQVDILINNAGIMNDTVWRKEIDININGTVHGILLGLEKYITKYKSGPEGLIINIASVLGIMPVGFMPIYVGTKFAVHGMTLAWGVPAHYERTKVRVVGVCPGITRTPLIIELPNRTLGPDYEDLKQIEFVGEKQQSPEEVGPLVMEIIERAPTGTIWVVEGGAPPFQYKMRDRYGPEASEPSLE
ncbi:unnamed protein product [Ceutorhynchus assimilis]|uniref:15-hydroxyprostaglandin dehydrogenase n=1 Tax=Ceutorhynchus assimilis TaxID=467358 RepID=A0A9N9QEC0_9CUCU|nr:unnamed protein product [Ceutorhynchus assimilis]